MDDARATFAALAQAEITIAKHQAQAEAKIAAVKTAHEAAVAGLVAERDALAGDLSQFILANPDAFVRPRAVKTDFGRFGRRDVSNVEILDVEKLIAWAAMQGVDNAVKVTRTPVKATIGAMLRDGVQVPGAALREGEEAFYSVDRALLDAAKRAG